jgi:hypothetical protein
MSSAASALPDRVPDVPGAPGVSADPLRRVERAAAGLATRSVALMDDRLPWFRSLPADQRSWVMLVAQAGIAGYLEWVRRPADPRAIGQVFGTAPRDLVRAVSLRRTVELVKVAISVAEEHLPALGSTPDEAAALRESLLRYSREIAFAAAAVYATAAETRGAWDARVEAAVVDGIVRGEDLASLSSRAATVGWDPTIDTQVIAGSAPPGDRTEIIAAAAEWVQAQGIPGIVGSPGGRLVLVVGIGVDDSVADLFGDGPVVRGPVGLGLDGAVHSAAEAFAALAVAPAWPGAPRPADADDLLVERVLAGDVTASERLVRTAFAPLARTPALLDTLDAYLGNGGSLEPAARTLFVHPNTMRYRLRRIEELTGRDPWDPRDLLALQIAVMTGRLRSLGD